MSFWTARSLLSAAARFRPSTGCSRRCHGAEIRGANGRVTALADPIPASVREFFQSLAGAYPGTMLEDKVYSLALHYRLAPEALPALAAAVKAQRALFAAEKVVVRPGKAVIDVKRFGIDKGTGVRALMREPPFLGRVPVFGGDDVTDADVFRILPELGGHGFSVGRAFEGAAYEFPSPRDVRQWLANLARAGVAA
jgi:trehalose 6-phosphate phosphatase